jgi:hypothetical protein
MRIRRYLLALVLGSLCLDAARSAAAAPSEDRRLAGRARVYSQLDQGSLEAVSTREAILSITEGNASATRIWQVLEHGEKVECLDCIPKVSKLLFNANAKTREISAWWLRRRIFGVFGKGEVYSQIVGTLNDKAQSEQMRAYAANALGEFLSNAGVKHVAKAVREDSSALVRAASVRALERLNTQGPTGELAFAIGDNDESVRLAALSAAIHVHVFSGIEAVATRLSDPSAVVRRRAAETLGALRATDAVAGLVALTSPQREADASVRAAAFWALGQLADASARDAVRAGESDPDPFAQSAARIALRRL